jgi:aminoglycoside phosphotransferase (APT) family kinase protein
MTDGVDLERLGAWMDDQGLPGGAITHVEPLTGGTQNILLRFDRGGSGYVLRRPPLHKRANSDDAMRREARVLAALAGTAVPHPRLLGACDDVEVLGAAFFLMEPVDGANPTVELPSRYREERAWRRELGLAMADGAALIGAVDAEAAGLTDLGRADGFLERQVARWQRQLASYSELDGYAGPDIPGVDEVAMWLDANRPTSWRPGLIHGDFHLANVLCRADRPALAAIVDWELSTIGDPLLDLGWLLATWPDGDTVPLPVAHIEPWDGFPDRTDLVARYAEHSDRDLSAIDWYEVLACFKLGIILEGTHARAAAGLAPTTTGDELHRATLLLFERALTRMAAA